MIPRTILRASFLSSLLLSLAVISARAEVKLHGLFSDNMVLQRDTAVPIWGGLMMGRRSR